MDVVKKDLFAAADHGRAPEQAPWMFRTMQSALETFSSDWGTSLYLKPADLFVSSKGLTRSQTKGTDRDLQPALAANDQCTAGKSWSFVFDSGEITTEDCQKSTRGVPDLRIFILFGEKRIFVFVDWSGGNGIAEKIERETHRGLRRLDYFHFACPPCSPFLTVIMMLMRRRMMMMMTRTVKQPKLRKSK